LTDAMKRLTISSKTYTQTVAALRKWGMSTIVTLIAFTRIGIVNTKLAYAFVCQPKEFYGQSEGQLFCTVSVNFAFSHRD